MMQNQIVAIQLFNHIMEHVLIFENYYHFTLRGNKDTISLIDFISINIC